MAAELLPMLARAGDSDNNPLSGALWYFYATGTTTPRSVYTTSALDVAHANPVVADSAGKFAPIYFDSSLVYRGVLKDAGGATIFDVDPINAGVLSTLAASTGAASVGFIQSGSGAIARTMQEKGRDEVHAFDFIPVAKHAGILAGTNTDDLATYLQAALDTGKRVRLPDTGMMWIGTHLLVPAGGGMVGTFGCTIKCLADFGDFSIIRNQTADPATLGARDQGIYLVGVRVDGNRANNTTGTEKNHGIRLNAVDGAWIDVWAENCKGDGVLLGSAYPLSEDGGTHPEVGCNAIFGRVRVEGVARQGLAIICAENVSLDVATIGNDLMGLDIEPDQTVQYCRNIQLRVASSGNGVAGSGTRGGVLIFGNNALGTGVCDVRNIDLTLTSIGDTGGGLIYGAALNLTARGTIDDVTGNGIESLSGNLGPSRVDLDFIITNATSKAFASRGASDIINGRFLINTTTDQGIQIEGAAGGRVTARLRGVGQQGINLHNANDMIVEADVHGCNGSGIYLTGTSSGNRFPNLRSTNSNFGFGFQELNTCDNNRATNARISGNGGGSVALVGANSEVRIEALKSATVADPTGGATVDAEARTAINAIIDAMQAQGHML